MIEGLLNRYAYVEGNPISYLDPFGMNRWIYDELHYWIDEIKYKISEVSYSASVLGIVIDFTPVVSQAFTVATTTLQLSLDLFSIGFSAERAFTSAFKGNYDEMHRGFDVMGDSFAEAIKDIYFGMVDFFMPYLHVGMMADYYSIDKKKEGN